MIVSTYTFITIDKGVYMLTEATTSSIVCTCPKECDCQNPPPERWDGRSGTYHISYLCPIHNHDPDPDENCPIHSHDLEIREKTATAFEKLGVAESLPEKDFKNYLHVIGYRDSCSNTSSVQKFLREKRNLYALAKNGKFSLHHYL
jgi:hypothetical protein